MVTGLLGWIFLGLIAGFIASKLLSKRGEGLLFDILLGVGGAVLGGWLFNAFGATGVTGLSAGSLLLAIVGAVVLLVAWYVIRRAVGHA